MRPSQPFTEAYKALNQAQRQAVDTIDGPLLIIAGPGTGKTQLLSLRVANILNRSDTNPQNILCLTYTESGQRAMQSRLMEIIGEQAGRIEVHTFHGFGRHLITKYQEHFPDLAGYRSADDLALYETLAGCFADLPHSSPLAKRSLGQWIYIGDVTERISQSKQAGLTPEDVKQRIAADVQWCDHGGKQLTKVFQNLGRLSSKAGSIVATELSSLGTKHEPGSLADACLSSLKVALDEVADSGKSTALSAWKRTWFSAEDGSLYFKPADQLQKLTVFAELYLAYETSLQKQKLYDYDDMILFALKALETKPELRALVQETYQYILADEYQDTNPAQARIIELIADNPVNEGRPNVMVVGDDDQAIYGFQGAFVGVMLYFRERWNDVVTITLNQNYRSTQAILDSARSVITQGASRLENYYEDIVKQLQATSEATTQPPSHIISPTPEATVEHLVSLARTVPRDGELAVIASKHRYLEHVAERFTTAHIPFFYEGRDDLLNDQEVRQILMYAETVLRIKQQKFERLDYILPELFTYELIPVNRHLIWAASLQAAEQKQPWWQIIDSSKDHQWREFASALRKLAADCDTNDGLASLHTVAARLFPDHQNQAILNQKLSSLTTHAGVYEQRKTISLELLLGYVRRCREAGIRLETHLESGTRDAPIKLMSAHKSKGQEFESVYLLHADEHTWFQERGRRNKLTLPPNWQHLQPATETFDDRLRILYVVMTRAKKHLRLLSSTTDRRGKPTAALPGTEEIVQQQIDSVELARPKSDNPDTAWQAWYLPSSKADKNALHKLLKPKLARYRLNPSHLTAFLDVTHGGPLNYFTHSLLKIPHVSGPEAIFGSHVHACLHYMQTTLNKTGRLPKRAELKQFVTDRMGQDTPSEINRVIDKVTDYQATTKALRPGGTPEYSFGDQQIVTNGVRISGTVDRFDVDGSSLSITDYKTGKPIKSWRGGGDYQKQKLRRYRQQLMFYELLFANSTDFSEITQLSSSISFVEPSRRGEFHQLVLDAKPQERADLQRLIAAVWRHIMELDFPNVSAYEPTLQGMIDFENQLMKSIISS